MNGRTYCGHYRGHYLKSTLEYIYARYLDYKEIHWEYEVQIFDLSTGGSYKPDFILSDGSYVEVKGRKNSAKVQKQTERLKAYNLLRQYQVFVTCHYCGKEFEVLFRKNKPQKYCSYSC